MNGRIPLMAGGVQWANIPQHWGVGRVGDVATLVNGFPFESESFSLGEGTPLIRIRDIGLGKTETYYAGPNQQEAVVRDGDVIVGMDGDFNVCWWEGGHALLNQRLCALRAKSGFDQRFLFYVLPIPLQLINDLTHSTTVKHLSSGDVRRLSIPHPPLSTQVAVANFLDCETAKIDALMQKNVLLLRKLLEQEQGVITAAVTRGLDPTAALKQTPVAWLRAVPADWNAKRLKFAAKRESGHTPSRTTPEYWQNCNIAWVSLNDVGYLAENDYISETAKNINELGLQNSSARMLPAGTVVLSRDATVGRCGILGKPMATSQHFVNYICGPELVPEYLLFVFRYAMQHEFMRLTMGSTLRTIGLPDVGSFAVPLPPVPEQRRIVAYVLSRRSELRAARQQLQRCNDLLGEYRSALITAAVTGQIDVRNYQAQGVASCQ